jgi:transposase
MTVPGVGAITALAVAAVMDRPQRFARSSSVAAYLGLTPKRHRSGEVDFAGHISRWGDGTLRGYLYEAAVALWSRHRGGSAPKTWAQGLIKRIGYQKACVALTRKLAVSLHAMGRAGADFQPEPAALPR